MIQSQPRLESVFDAAAQDSSASGQCVQCRGSKLLCGKTRCPIMVKWDFLMKTQPLIDSFNIDGSSPPGVFVGRFGYPKVYVGPLVPPFHADTAILDMPEQWLSRSIEDIVSFRSQLVRGMHRVHVMDVENGGRIVDLTRELALSTMVTDVEVEFTKRPFGRIVLDDETQPFGPSAPLKTMDISSYKVDAKLDKAYSDTDLKAVPAVLGLYREGIPVSKIQRAFSVGAFGLEDNRKFVPTRWSITAVDDTIGKNLREKVKRFPLINEYRVYESIGYDDRFLVIMMPHSWMYELIEAWYPGTLWNPTGQQTWLINSHEYYGGRTTYADIGGCYYAARLAVAEKLEGERRQAATVILRETHPGYIMPIGVWNVRENVRRALRTEPANYSSLNEVFGHLSTRLDIPMSRYIKRSEILRYALHQRTVDDFIGC